MENKDVKNKIIYNNDPLLTCSLDKRGELILTSFRQFKAMMEKELDNPLFSNRLQTLDSSAGSGLPCFSNLYLKRNGAILREAEKF